jgi:inactive STAND
MNRGSDQRCFLTDEGKNALEELLKLAYPSGFKHSSITNLTKLRSETVTKILKIKKIDPTKNDPPVSVESFGTFCRVLYKRKLTLEQQQQYNRTYPGLNLLLENPSTDTKYCKQIVESNADRLKRTRQMAELLCKLDYRDQEGIFKDRIRDVYSQAIAFSLSAPCKSTQKWLMYRLLQLENSSGMDGATTIILDRSSPILSTWNLSTICAQISRTGGLGIQYRNPAQVIEDLAAYNQAYHPVLIKVFGLQNEAERDVLINEFWQELIQHIPIKPQGLLPRAKQSRLMMFLLEQDALELSPVTDSDRLFPLTAPEINIGDITDWIVERNVNKILKTHRTEKYIYDDFPVKILPKWDCWHQDRLKKLYGSFQGLCKLFRVEYKLTELENYWDNQI